MKLRISTRAVAGVLCLIIALLTAISVIGQVCRFTIHHGQVHWWVAAFDLNREQNIPTYYQGVSIFVCALILAVICIGKFRSADRFRWAWVGLGITFVFLSIDETCSLHEQMHDLMDAHGVHLHGLFYYSWVVPALIFVFVFGLFYLRFPWRLPAPFRWWTIASGFAYVFGAVGLEMVGADYAEKFGDNNLTFQLVNNVEELFEMTGIAMFMLCLLRYMREQMPRIVLQIEPDRPQAMSRPAHTAAAPAPAAA